MDIGMLWYDDDAKRNLDEKVARAVSHYRSKYGVTPTICFVNPKMLPPGLGVAAGVQLRPASTVMIHHFWVGVVESPGAVAKRRGDAAEAGARVRRT
jgi:hypothetical protein